MISFSIFPLIAAVCTTFLAVATGLQIAGDKTKASRPNCVVWHSQHKAAGSAIVMTLKQWHSTQIVDVIGKKPLEYRNDLRMKCEKCCDAETWDCETQTCSNTDLRSKVTFDCDPSIPRVAVQGYTPVLAGSQDWGSPGDGKCVWATMSREPVSRLVSAFLYCKYNWGHDPLCGRSRLNAKESSIQDFAQHWGNFLFRELMWHPQLREAAGSRKNFNATSLDCRSSCTGRSLNSFECNTPPEPWLQFKNQLNGGDDPHTEDGALNLEAVKQALRGDTGWKPLYDVYGVVEMWNETMAMYDKLMPFADGWSWTLISRQFDHNSENYKAEEESTLLEAKNDPVVLKALAADIEIYEQVILPRFQGLITNLG